MKAFICSLIALVLICALVVLCAVFCGSRLEHIEKEARTLTAAEESVSFAAAYDALTHLTEEWDGFARFLRLTVHTQEIERADDLLSLAKGALLGEDRALFLSTMHRLCAVLADLEHTVRYPRV